MTLRIEIPKRALSCQQCSLAFSPGKTVVSRLVLGDKGAILRFDSCSDCFATLSSDKKEISCWKTVVPDERKKVSSKQKGESAKELFENLFRADEKEPSKLYLLALYLERRRIFARRGEINQDGQDMIVFESVRTGDVYTVPSVSEIAFDKTLDDLQHIL